MNCAVGGQNHRAPLGKGQTNQTRSCNGQGCFAGGRDLDNAAFARERSGHVEIAFRIEGHALGTSQTTEKSRHVALRCDLVNAIKTRSGRPGHEQVAMGAKSQMVCGNAWFESCEDEDLAVGANLENGAAAVADVKIVRAVEGNTCRNA